MCNQEPWLLLFSYSFFNKWGLVKYFFCVFPLIRELHCNFLSSTVGNSETGRRINNLFKRKYHSIFFFKEQGKSSQRTWILLRETFSMTAPPTSSSLLPRISCPQLAHCLLSLIQWQDGKKQENSTFQREMGKFNCGYLESWDWELEREHRVTLSKLKNTRIQIF